MSGVLRMIGPTVKAVLRSPLGGQLSDGRCFTDVQGSVSYID